MPAQTDRPPRAESVPLSPPGDGARSGEWGRLDLFVVSFLSLFLEIAMIRYLPSQVRVISYYANIALLSAFLGLALGCLRTEGRRGLFDLAGVVLAAGLLVVVGLPRLLDAATALNRPAVNTAITVVLVAAAAALFVIVFVRAVRRAPNRRLVIALTVGGAVLIGGFVVAAARAGGLSAIFAGTHIWEAPDNQLAKIALVPLMFGINCAIFFPIGVRLGRCFDAHPPIIAYTVNVLGALLGVIALSGVSWWSAPPVVWFGIAFACILYLARRGGARRLLVSAAAAVIAVAVVFIGDRGTTWSPYYNIRTHPMVHQGRTIGTVLEVNRNFHQYSLDLRPDQPTRVDELEHLRDYYDLPYRLVTPKSVLVVGSGTGNDVAAALRAGVPRVDAVEIDPTIAALGDEHPERPYAHPGVRLIVDDARSYFRTAHASYDLIVFGLLDSQQLLSYMSSVRLDSYVYTRESLREAMRLLAPDGIVCLSFSVGKEWLGTKIAQTIREAAGREPLIVEFKSMFHVNTVYLYSSSPAALDRVRSRRLAETMTVTSKPADPAVVVATDDWPYFYMKSRSISNTYLVTLVALAVLAVLFIMAVSPPEVTVTAGRFFWLGAGFMLLETRSITALSLLFGSTWVVNSLVIATILAMIVAANLIILKRRPGNVRVWYVLLFAALALNYFVPVTGPFFSQSLLTRILAGCLAALPLFFAAFIFGISFRTSQHPRSDLGANLLGSVAGGLVEYASLVVGLQALYLLAAAFYAMSALRGRKASVRAAAAPDASS